MSFRELMGAVLCVLALWSPARVGATPRFVYLTWQEDPATAVTVNYHTLPPSTGAAPAPGLIVGKRAVDNTTYVEYDLSARVAAQGSYRFWARGTFRAWTSGTDRRLVHRVVLRELLPDTRYSFVVGDDTNSPGEPYSFRTAPRGRAPITFISGGDMGLGARSGALLAQAARQSPLFCLLGGDLAYAGAVPEHFERWDRWLENWQRNMVTPDKRLVPLVLALGNHDVDRRGQAPTAPFFFGYFAQSERSYFARRVGDIALFVLDSGHMAAHAGGQRAWLDRQLRAHRDARFRIAVYHVPLYPGYRPLESTGSQQGRTHWRPLFDQYHLTTAFENHDHMLKRTKLLRADREDPEGTLYLGDGCFGVTSRIVKGPRQVDRGRRWYLAKAATGAHFWRVDVADDGVRYRALDAEGRVLDEAFTESD